MNNQRGSKRTKEFYDRIGWQQFDGSTYDNILFGDKELGSIRVELNKVHRSRIREFISPSGSRVKLLECGCGGQPERDLFDLCSSYTGVDFSDLGLEVAKSCLEEAGLEYQLQNADICALPFPDNSFDAVYCAHMLYHIDNPAAQETAVKEMLRVLRRNGKLVIVTANPRPLLFPVRFATRLLDDTPIVNSMLRRLKKGSPLPYKPRKISWYRRVLKNTGQIDIVSGGLPSTWFNQSVSEHNGLGKILWRIIKHLDLNYPKMSSYLGNFVIVTSCKEN